MRLANIFNSRAERVAVQINPTQAGMFRTAKRRQHAARNYDCARRRNRHQTDLAKKCHRPVAGDGAAFHSVTPAL
jgi:hypothetical protein